MSIRLLQNDALDKAKWDACIDSSPNGLLYAKSFYLDNATGNQWLGLVLNNYEAVMPLCIRKKIGISYLYQPAFVQQGGIFSVVKIDDSLVESFLKKLYEYFRFAEINLNYSNFSGAITTLKPLSNFTLVLGKYYEQVYTSYKSNFTKNVKRASNVGFSYEKEESYQALVTLYKNLYSARMKHVTENDYLALARNCEELSKEGRLVLRKATLDKKTEAAAILLLYKNRLYNIANSVTSTGKQNRANYFLFDNIIREFSNSGYTLDLEGSDIKGIADFYESMGALNEPYPALHFNHLPQFTKMAIAFIKWLRP